MAEDTCSVHGCVRPAHCRGWCRTHYNRWHRTGDTQADKPLPSDRPAHCSVNECGSTGRLRRGLCPTHYSRWMKTGHVGSAAIRRRRSRITDGAVCSTDGCTKPDKSAGFCTGHYARFRQFGDVRASIPLGSRQRPKQDVCVVDGCSRGGPFSRGWCSTHYGRWQKTGDVGASVPIRAKAADRCGVDGCTGGRIRAGWCSTHYQRLKRTGSLTLPSNPNKERICSVDGCGKPWRAGDYCGTHWQRWRKHGDPHVLLRERSSSPPETCTEPDCAAPHYAKGRCRRHDLQHRHQANKAQINARHREHYRLNREQAFASAARRRQRARVKLDAFDRELATAYRQAIKGDDCRYCGAPGEAVDHYFPLAKGGTDHWWNLVRSCGSCNSSKAAHCGTWFLLQPAVGSQARRL